ncbi:CBS domain-containing protein [Pseudonocardia saturnea]
MSATHRARTECRRIYQEEHTVSTMDLPHDDPLTIPADSPVSEAGPAGGGERGRVRRRPRRGRAVRHRGVDPRTSIGDAATIMRRQAVRRRPAVQDGRVVGVVSLGDLAVDLDPHSVPADISAAGPHL